MDSKLSKAAQISNIVGIFPGLYCAYGSYILLHNGISQVAPLQPQMQPGGDAAMHTVNPTVLLISFVVFLVCIGFSGIVGLARSSSRNPVAIQKETPSSSWVRFISATAEIAGEPAKKPQKIRCEFLNCTAFSYKVRVIGWESGSRGLYADFWRECLQLRIVNTWCPESNGVAELHIPPSEAFRFWLFPEADFSNEQFRARINIGNLGTVHLLIDGTEVAIPVR